MKILLFHKTTDSDLKKGLQVCYQDLNGSFTKLGVITEIVKINNVKNYILNTSMGAYAAEDLKLIAKPMTTIKPYTLSFKHYGQITVPAGTPVTHKTACGIDEKIHFVDSTQWIDENYKDIASILKHDVIYYGIDVPKEFIQY